MCIFSFVASAPKKEKSAGILSLDTTTSRFAAKLCKMLPSLIEELQARGYDITTLKFSIQRKVTG